MDKHKELTMHLATDPLDPINASNPQAAFPIATNLVETSYHPSKSAIGRQRQTTRGVTKTGSALGGAIPNAPVFIPAERLRNPSSR
jgi:hypothetical protein